MTTLALPPIDYLRQRLRHDPGTGKLYWRADAPLVRKNWNTRFGGREAFTAIRNTGYRHGRIDDVCYQAHRVIWALHYGADPVGHLDHIDHDKLNNRIENLRIVNHQENHRNTSRRRNNTSGHMGVSWFAAGNKWSAYIMVDRKKKHLGYFDRLDDAVAARRAAEATFGFHENHGIAGACAASRTDT
jgi:hypothetical protein